MPALGLACALCPTAWSRPPGRDAGEPRASGREATPSTPPSPSTGCWPSPSPICPVSAGTCSRSLPRPPARSSSSTAPGARLGRRWRRVAGASGLCRSADLASRSPAAWTPGRRSPPAARPPGLAIAEAGDHARRRRRPGERPLAQTIRERAALIEDPEWHRIHASPGRRRRRDRLVQPDAAEPGAGRRGRSRRHRGELGRARPAWRPGRLHAGGPRPRLTLAAARRDDVPGATVWRRRHRPRGGGAPGAERARGSTSPR
jgi:hypothetical protein